MRTEPRAGLPYVETSFPPERKWTEADWVIATVPLPDAQSRRARLTPLIGNAVAFDEAWGPYHRGKRR